LGERPKSRIGTEVVSVKVFFDVMLFLLFASMATHYGFHAVTKAKEVQQQVQHLFQSKD
jgi:hypothetical protein